MIEGFELDRSIPQPSRKDKVVAFDIETFEWKEKQELVNEIVSKASEGYVKPDTIKKYQEEALEKLALSPLTGQVILAGFYDGENLKYHQGDEKDLVRESLKDLNQYLLDGYRLVTKGGKRFDLPYLIARAAILGIIPEWSYGFKEIFSRYDNYYHVDLETVFDRTVLDKAKLGTLGYAFGIVDKLENKGDEIAQMYKDDKMDEIIKKNTNDLIITYNIYKKVQWINL